MQSLMLAPIAPVPPPVKGPRSRPLFTGLETQRGGRWHGFLASGAFHLVLILSAPFWPNQFTDPSERLAWLRQERLLRTLRIRVPERLYLASSGAQPAAPKKSLRYPREQRPAASASQLAEGARRGRASGRRRRFDLPKLAQRPLSDQTLIQPRYAAQLAPPPQLELPEMFFWSPQLQPQNQAKAYVQPGHAVPPTGPRVLDTSPRLDMPQISPDALAAAWNLMDPTGTFTLSSAAPIRSDYGTTVQNGVTADPLKGDPATLLSISANPLPLREYLAVPPGNQVGRIPAAGPEGAGGADGSGRGPQGNGASGALEGQSGSGTGAGQRAGAAGNSPGTANGGASAASSPAVGSNAAASSNANGTPSSYEALSPEVQATRIEHPANGVFDVVVQSSGLEGFPESAGVLSGKPVYSVFLAEGAANDWVLQDCIPFGEEDNATFDGGVVTLGTPARVSAPYPRVTFRPPLSSRLSGYLMLHGFLSEAGRFQELKILGITDPQERAVLGAMDRWEFRPAMRTGKPVRVEILLAIPAE